MKVVSMRSEIYINDECVVHHMSLDHRGDKFIVNDLKYEISNEDYLHEFHNEYTKVELEQQLSLWFDCNINSEFLSCCYEYLSNLN